MIKFLIPSESKELAQLSANLNPAQFTATMATLFRSSTTLSTIDDGGQSAADTSSSIYDSRFRVLEVVVEAWLLLWSKEERISEPKHRRKMEVAAC